MTFSHVQFAPASSTAKLIYSRNGGAVERPLPPGKPLPEGTTSVAWDAETLTLTCILDDESTETVTLTPAEIEAQSTAQVDEPLEPVILGDWLARVGYPTDWLTALLDFELKLSGAGVTCPEAVTVRAWYDGLMARYASGTTRANDWASPPYTFEELTTAAATILAAE